MVSTRGIKLKFYEGERVLCYEPDPTKAKVLYDSKVMEVIVNKDPRGRKNVEYLIHFQGWNSSWDRCVGEEFVLKDTAENRQLQRDLADKAQLQLGAYLYRRERKKHNRKLSDRISQLSEDGSSGSPTHLDYQTEDLTSSSEEDSSMEEDLVPVELTKDLQEVLEIDYHLIHERNKLHKIPAEPCIITILEKYWKQYATNQIYCLTEKSNSGRYRNQQKKKPEEIQRNLNVCKEVLDGLRIYFDFTLNDLLLYRKEQGQCETAAATFMSSIPTIKHEVLVKTELEDLEYAHLPNMGPEEDILERNNGQEFTESNCTPAKRRILRSYRSQDSETNGNTPELSQNSSTNVEQEVPTAIAKIVNWKILPDHVYSQQPPPPSLVYGATHLLRLFVKLPELLNSSSMADNKLKVLLRHLDDFIDYLSDQKELFGEKYYTEA
ncbi:male-specific lethal 3 homolog [Agrilus planipennis]|uniref:Protein male-specific lethal-3 n=1 Tax=Agrilus planipennis TaxID=224129 RepID=A0A1W4X891_AGRPL|nr:male-specific lethal 3 homolog [Agrilus planipennis]